MAILLCALVGSGQQIPPNHESRPIYTVTVVERTAKAINYEYRTGPTKIDFRGTVLLPYGRGEATVESLRGRTEIDAKFENLTPPTRYGREYLTYTLWAITPEGAPHNLGEVVAGGSDKAHLHVTTELQAFGLIVTAEPYSATRRPSDVVVMENEVRPDTVGKIQLIQAKYELMPRGEYTYEVPATLVAAEAAGPKLPMDRYEALLEVYEAQNAVGIARAADAETYATPTFQKAEGLLAEAQRMQAGGGPSNAVVQEAREAAQTAEDARSIAERRRQDLTLARAQAEAARAQQVQADALNEARQARVEADAARAQAELERSARERAEADAAGARRRAELAMAAAAQASEPVPAAAQAQPGAAQSELRRQLLRELSGVLATRDTPRGLVATLSDSEFSGWQVRPMAAQQLARMAAIVAVRPGLRVEVEGHSDSAASAEAAWGRAAQVQRILMERGLPRETVAARGLGDSRPLVSNASPGGRVQNRRVEIVISGDPIGTLPSWDRTYSITPAQMVPRY